jgi:DNA polymerase-3 subunit epsilon
MMFRQWRLRKRCRELARKCRQASLESYIEQCAGQTVDRLVDTPLISVDLELTGLDAGQNKIIAIGWTKIDKGRIRFGTNRHIIVNAEQSVGHSAAIHELTDSEVAMGAPLEYGLETLFEAAQGRVWLFCHAGYHADGIDDKKAARSTGASWGFTARQASCPLSSAAIYGS